MQQLGSTGPAQPEWFSEPIAIDLPYEGLEPAFGDEFVVSIQVPGISTSLLVPQKAVNTSTRTVGAWAIGVVGNYVLVDVAPSTMGANRLKVHQSAIARFRSAR